MARFSLVKSEANVYPKPWNERSLRTKMHNVNARIAFITRSRLGAFENGVHGTGVTLRHPRGNRRRAITAVKIDEISPF